MVVVVGRGRGARRTVDRRVVRRRRPRLRGEGAQCARERGREGPGGLRNEQGVLCASCQLHKIVALVPNFPHKESLRVIAIRELPHVSMLYLLDADTTPHRYTLR